MRQLLEPFVLECMQFVASSDTEGSRTVKNYEFDLYLGGEREITIDGERFSINRGSLVFRKPGEFTVGKGDYNMFMLTLDFTKNQIGDNLLFRGKTGEIQTPCEFFELTNIPSVFTPEHFDELLHLYKRLSECSYPNILDRARQKEYIKEFLLLVLYDAQKHNRRRKERKSTANMYIKGATSYINAHFAEDISVKELAAILSLNQNYLIRLFKTELGTTPNKYILETRLLRARLMLLQTDQTVKEVALSCGFNVPSYFTKCFNERFGQNPLDFRKNGN